MGVEPRVVGYTSQHAGYRPPLPTPVSSFLTRVSWLGMKKMLMVHPTSGRGPEGGAAPPPAAPAKAVVSSAQSQPAPAKPSPSGRAPAMLSASSHETDSNKLRQRRERMHRQRHYRRRRRHNGRSDVRVVLGVAGPTASSTTASAAKRQFFPPHCVHFDYYDYKVQSVCSRRCKTATHTYPPHSRSCQRGKTSSFLI